MKINLYSLQRRALFVFLFILFQSSILFSQQVAKSIPYPSSPDGLIGFLQFTPSDYGTQKHPLIVFLHGIGERGNGTSQLYSITSNAIPKYCAAGASMRFTVGGQTSSFVVLSPQLSTQYGYWPTFYVKEMIKYAKANLQIDTNRIYITGLSLGGGGIWRVITDTYNFDHTFDASIAAAAPVCGTQEMSDYDFCSTIGTNHLPIWAFHAMDDGVVGVGATQHGEILANMCGVTPAPKFTYYQYGNHVGAWLNAYDTGHITTIVNGGGSFTANPNLYEWFLSKTRATGNQSPVANAGSNISITLPTSSTTLNGSASNDPDGSIATYAWSKTSGPTSYTIANAGAASTALSNLVQGVYVFTLQVTDNSGATASSTVTVTVNAAANQSPVSNAGSNISITLPTNSTTLNGSASSDADGTISTYAWSKTSGPASYSIANAGAASTALSNLVQGVYVFTLQVTDNSGATASSTVTVTVNAAVAPPPPVNQAPVSNAGSNISITLPTNSTTLNGSTSSDADGTISTYAWSKTSGPASYIIANAGAVNTGISNLVQGVYVFTLQVTDNAGASASSVVTVTVNAAPNQAPVANAGADITITLPLNTTALNGTGSSDTDGTIASYSWNKVAGPGATTIVNSNTAAPSVIGLVQGQYTFELTITDNNGATGTDQVIVTVNPEPNKVPVANAGKDTSMALPAASAILSGSSSADADGTITQYSWKQVSGPSAAVIVQPGAIVTTVNSLVEGEYIFELKVTDNAGAIATARVKVSLVNNFRYSQFFKLYPNPAVNSINFQFIDDIKGKLNVAAYDVNGRLVVNQEFSKDQSLITQEINISHLKPGMYYLEVRQADGKKLIRPFVKQ
ncbi:MAG: PKD domain-containing protein [Chitinophagaceae bacterium]